MTIAQNGNTVKVHYTGTLSGGEVFDSSVGKDPLTFKVGGGQVISGFDDAVAGMAIGEKKTVHIPCADAYGEHDEDLVFEISRTELPDDLNPQIGDMLQMQNGSGQVIGVEVSDINDEFICLDANHPLAGEDLTFEIELVEIA